MALFDKTPRIVKLRIKVPANVTVVTELIKQPVELSIAPTLGRSVGNTPSVMEMDLTSQKTSEWLRKKIVASSDCGNCCCVRG